MQITHTVYDVEQWHKFYKTKSLQNVHVWCPRRNTHMITLKWFRFIIAKIYNILQYVIAPILCHMCNLHMKETEISQKRSKGKIKNWKITYSVILSVLSNKTNLILGFSSPLKKTVCLQNKKFVYCRYRKRGLTFRQKHEWDMIIFNFLFFHILFSLEA